MELILCNNCGNKLMLPSELINVKIVHLNEKNQRKEEEIKVCCECYGHILKYQIDDMGFYKVDNDFKLYYIKIKRLYTKKKDKKQGDLIVPNVMIKGKVEEYKHKPYKFSFVNKP